MNKARFSGMQATLMLVLLGIFISTSHAEETITIGLNISLSGSQAYNGASCKAGAELLRSEINAAGGVKVGDISYKLNYAYADNESSPHKSVTEALRLITQNKVLAIVGPTSSAHAIPAGGICDSFKTPMISPTSTNPKTTIDRPYVFRACFLDSFQGEVMASFAVKEFKAEKAAVLYNIASAYPKGLAEYFKNNFEAQKGEGSVVAYEDFLSSEKDLSLQLDKIVSSDADVLFLPQYANEVPDIVKQAREKGWDKIILGGDAWESTELMEKCGDLCKGLYFSSHFAAIGATGKTKVFVDHYEVKNKEIATGYAALTYDSVNLIITAISKLDSLGDNLLETRAAIKNNLAKLKGYEGVSGTLDMNAAGDPSKSAVVIKINDQGEFEAYKTEHPKG